MDDLKEIKKVSDDHLDSGESHYPYGTSFNLQDGMIDDFDVADCQVGDEVMVYMKAKIVSRSEHDDESYSDRSLRLQPTHMKIDKGDDGKDRADKLYGDD